MSGSASMTCPHAPHHQVTCRLRGMRDGDGFQPRPFCRVAWCLLGDLYIPCPDVAPITTQPSQWWRAQCTMMLYLNINAQSGAPGTVSTNMTGNRMSFYIEVRTRTKKMGSKGKRVLCVSSWCVCQWAWGIVWMFLSYPIPSYFVYQLSAWWSRNVAPTIVVPQRRRPPQRGRRNSKVRIINCNHNIRHYIKTTKA